MSSTNTMSAPTFGISQPISQDFPNKKDLLLNKSLTETLKSFNCFEPSEETSQRVKVLNKLNFLVKKWIHLLTITRIPMDVDAGGKLIAFGSYRLGVHSSGSDIDTLVLAPRHVTRMDFFSSFKKILLKDSEVKDLQAVETAFVPIMTLKYSGIEIDLLFARLDMPTVPDNIDLSDENILKNLDPESVRSLNGCRVAEQLLKQVPNQLTFCETLRAVKLWAKNHGIYSNAMGFFGGITWAILVARTCQLYPNAAPSKLIQKVFFVFSTWNWPSPVILKHMEDRFDMKNLKQLVWDSRRNFADRLHLMPIITPSFPEQNSTHNVSRSTLQVIQKEMKEAFKICEDIQKGKATWKDLLEETNFFCKYKHFIAISINAEKEKEETQFAGFFESRIRQLVQLLERNSQVQIAQVNTRKFKASSSPGKSQWFIGLEFIQEAKNLDLTEEIKRFKKIIGNQAKEKIGTVQIDAVYVKRSNLITYISAAELKRGKFMKKETSPEKENANRKRPTTKKSGDDVKKPRTAFNSIGSVQTTF
ncbi:hypothetical protein GCK72_005077 [Caenorhabditis remanei]|uniref:Poly(A) polymerase n=1 Tax=Caenorhabditis remanei TaxID=31234 RepID=A0A6A5HCV5_CAERE|nr:hypothetical protein GCK72_005077 [Caenorhabditis remanei]KAF1765125.1 hypothetical protein GCK72_005077 [Caenorhabditis remanei]